MVNNRDSNQSKADTKDLLLQDYRYFAESFWKNEQSGETRINLFIGIVTLVVGALVRLATGERGLSREPLRLVSIASLFALLVFGFTCAKEARHDGLVQNSGLSLKIKMS